MPKAPDARDDILSLADQAIFFRQRKVEEYPDDWRNQRSVDELQRLRAYIEALPAEHSLFRSWDAAWAQIEDDAMQFFEDILESAPGQTDIFARYGFHGREDPESFCEELAERLADFVREGGGDGSVFGFSPEVGD